MDPLKGKVKGILYELSTNARVSTKELGKRLKISQQSASYLVRSLQQKGIIQHFSTIIDPAKLGYISVLAYFNYMDYTQQTREEILQYLQQVDSVVYLAELEQGHDVMVLFCVPNLSSFNKVKKEFLQTYRNRVCLAETHPVIVHHLYQRKYLFPRKPASEFVVSGDREVLSFSDTEKEVLRGLWDDPIQSIIDIHCKTKLNPKTIVKIKKKLEGLKVIRGYTGVFDLPKVGIGKQLLQFSSEHLSPDEDKKLLHFSMIHPQIISLTRVIGNFDLLVETEGSEQERGAVLKEMRKEFAFHKYNVINLGKIHKNKYVPRGALS